MFMRVCGFTLFNIPHTYPGRNCIRAG
uniref:Uncharacterized protein n=1 Tax=Anguilla anguilla TaxID=7936 RepID=A0A0E9VMX1_ANGAN